MKRNLVLLSLITAVVLAASALPAAAQEVWQITTTPTFVINTGRAEALGNVRITATITTANVPGTVEYLYQNVGCDNNTASGITLIETLATATAVIQSVTNTSIGCVVAVAIGTANAITAGEFVEVQGVRGRVDFLGGLTNTGQNINASLSATPSNTQLFTIPNQGVVGITAVGLEVVSVTAGSALQCIGQVTAPSVTVREGFNGAFVQHNVTTTNATVEPASPRPDFGAAAPGNTQVRFEVAGVPTGVTLTWPAFVNSQLNGGVFTAGAAGSRLERITTATATSQTYEFACGDQGVCDINTEIFIISPVLGVTATSGFGTATLQVRLFPDLITGDATSITSVPGAAGIARPRFNDPLRPVPAAAIATNSPCTTNILFPFVANTFDFDTGLAISNTSADDLAFGANLPTGVSAAPQAGTCTFNLWPGPGDGTAAAASSFTSPSIAAGGHFAVPISAVPAFAGKQGYVITVCNFQFGHGYAFIVNNFGVGAPSLAQGYLALLIPDPVIQAGRRANPSIFAVAQSGEGLNQ